MMEPNQLDEFGGYPQQAFAVAVIDDLTLMECPICFKILKNPKQCHNGHLFCNQCIQEALKLHKRCPLCNCVMDADLMISPCGFFSDLLKQISMKCLIENCLWKGPLSAYDAHFQDCKASAKCCIIRGCLWKTANNSKKNKKFASHLRIRHRLLIRPPAIRSQNQVPPLARPHRMGAASVEHHIGVDVDNVDIPVGL